MTPEGLSAALSVQLGSISDEHSALFFNPKYSWGSPRPPHAGPMTATTA